MKIKYPKKKDKLLIDRIGPLMNDPIGLSATTKVVAQTSGRMIANIMIAMLIASGI